MVVLRIRKMNESERMDSQYCERSYVVFCQKNHHVITVGRDRQARSFRFPLILQEDATQEQAFAPVIQLIENALKGYNCSVFAYGQTGSGKTYTLSGGAFKKNGIIQQTIRYLEKILKGDLTVTMMSVKCTMV